MGISSLLSRLSSRFAHPAPRDEPRISRPMRRYRVLSHARVLDGRSCPVCRLPVAKESRAMKRTSSAVPTRSFPEPSTLAIWPIADAGKSLVLSLKSQIVASFSPSFTQVDGRLKIWMIASPQSDCKKNRSTTFNRLNCALMRIYIRSLRRSYVPRPHGALRPLEAPGAAG